MNKNTLIETVLIPYLIPILLVTFISVIALLFLNRFTISGINILNKKLERKINAFLPEILLGEFSETGLSVEIEKFKSEVYLNTYRFREFLIKSLIESENSLKGVDEKKFHKVFVAFKLHKHSYRFLKSFFIYYKKKGIYQMQMMNYRPAAKEIKRYISHKNLQLSANALIAYILLAEKDISFLTRIKHELSFAKEIEILEICKIKKLKRPELLKDFLFSKNDFIVKVGLRLAVYYNASDLEHIISKCMYHKNPAVRELAYKALGDLFLVDNADEMISRYDEETKTNKTQIVLSLGKIGNKSHLDFLKPLLLRSHHNELGIARAIKSIDPKSLSLMELNDRRVNNLTKHINQNPII